MSTLFWECWSFDFFFTFILFLFPFWTFTRLHTFLRWERHMDRTTFFLLFHGSWSLNYIKWNSLSFSKFIYLFIYILPQIVDFFLLPRYNIYHFIHLGMKLKEVLFNSLVTIDWSSLQNIQLSLSSSRACIFWAFILAWFKSSVIS